MVVAKVRQAAVAGSFYEADGNRLRRHVQALLDAAPAAQGPPPHALVVPHAGYIYSGATAAHAYRLLQGHAAGIRRVLMLGPAHTVPLRGMAVPAAGTFTTPLGEIRLDPALLAAARALPCVSVSDDAHRRERCLEVQLPFLQTVLGDFSLAPVVVGHCDAQDVAALIDRLWDPRDTLLVISTDLSHFLSYFEARERDAHTCRRILNRATDIDGEEACGAHALNGLAESRRARELRVELLHLCNSGDTAGDRQRVVGYGAFALH